MPAIARYAYFIDIFRLLTYFPLFRLFSRLSMLHYAAVIFRRRLRRFAPLIFLRLFRLCLIFILHTPLFSSHYCFSLFAISLYFLSRLVFLFFIFDIFAFEPRPLIFFRLFRLRLFLSFTYADAFPLPAISPPRRFWLFADSRQRHYFITPKLSADIAFLITFRFHDSQRFGFRQRAFAAAFDTLPEADASLHCRLPPISFLIYWPLMPLQPLIPLFIVLPPLSGQLPPVARYQFQRCRHAITAITPDTATPLPPPLIRRLIFRAILR
jgi:hypothetical protein